jgi:hypothetical protein
MDSLLSRGFGMLLLGVGLFIGGILMLVSQSLPPVLVAIYLIITGLLIAIGK